VNPRDLTYGGDDSRIVLAYLASECFRDFRGQGKKVMALQSIKNSPHGRQSHLYSEIVGTVSCAEPLKKTTLFLPIPTLKCTKTNAGVHARDANDIRNISAKFFLN